MRVVVLLVVLGMLGCTPFDVAKSILDPKGAPSLEVDTTIGDKEEAVVGQVGNSSEIVAESLSGGVNTTYVQDTPIWVWLIAILGWMFPSPGSIYSEIKSWFKRK